ncbi:MAG: grxC [Phenylobacterium sp.]|nr:grxC [Phenylobacterium sp.]
MKVEDRSILKSAMTQVTIYTKPYCPYCIRALTLLEKKGVAFTEIEAAFDPDKRAEMLQKSGGRATFPQIFVGERHIGGCDEMMALEYAGQLDPLLQAA